MDQITKNGSVSRSGVKSSDESKYKKKMDQIPEMGQNTKMAQS